MSTKVYAGFFLFCLDRGLFAKIKKTLLLHTRFFKFLLIIQDLKKLKNPEHSFVDIIKSEICAKFYQKILNCMVVRARQSFQFFR